MKIVNLEQGTQEWLQWRLSRITATDSVAIRGISPYKTARDLFFEKMGFGEAADSSKEFIFAQGHKVEELLRGHIKTKTGLDFKPICAEYSPNKRLAASLDGYIKTKGLTEMKLLGSSVIKSIKKHGIEAIPEPHRVQMQKQLLVAEEDKGFYSCHDNKDLGLIKEIGRDEDLIKDILRTDIEFLELMDKNQAPDLTERDTLYLTDEKAREKFRELVLMKKKLDELKSEYSLVEKEVKDLAIHPRIFCEGVSITTYEKKGNVDYKNIPELQLLGNKYIEKYRKNPSIVKTLTIKKGV